MTSVRSGVRKVAYLKRSPANTLSRASREPVSARDSIASGPRIGGRQANKSAQEGGGITRRPARHPNKLTHRRRIGPRR